jgi:hypothetical protein
MLLVCVLIIAALLAIASGLWVAAVLVRTLAQKQPTSEDDTADQSGSDW